MNEPVRPETLESLDALQVVLERSSERPQLLFKHSLYCGLSGMAFDEYQTHLRQPDPGVDYWLITVQTGRAISNAVEERLGISHATPQAILVRDGRAVWNASHRGVNARSLAEATATAAAGFSSAGSAATRRAERSRGGGAPRTS
jgi:bacillithiol system protein YtxJ